MDPAIQTPIGEAGQAPPPPPIPEEKKTSKKLIVTGIILAVLLVILILVIGRIAWVLLDSQNPRFCCVIPSKDTITPSPTSDPTANWKTYTDINNKFSLQYPSELAEYETDDEEKFGTGIGFRNPNECKTCGGNQFEIEVYTPNNPQKLTTEEFLKQYYKDAAGESMVDSFMSLYKQEQPTGNITSNWMRGRNLPTGGTSLQSAAIPQGNIMIIINCSECSNELFDQILSTFKFNVSKLTKQQAESLVKEKMKTMNYGSLNYTVTADSETNESWHVSVYDEKGTAISFFGVNKDTNEVLWLKP